MRNPVLRYGRAVAEPHALARLDVLEEPRQRADATRAADDPAVQADRHHARAALGAHAIQPVEGVAVVEEVLLARGEVAAALQATVVVVESVGYDEMGAAPTRVQ